MNAVPGGISGDLSGRAPLVPANLAREKCAPLIEKIGLGSEVAHRIFGQLSYACDAPAPNPWFALWQEHCRQHFDPDAGEAILAEHVKSPAGTRLFLAHSYCKIVLTEFVGLALGRPGASGSAGLYDWVDHLKNMKLKALRHELRHQIAAIDDPARLGPLNCSDLLAAIYQEFFPPTLRHVLGEYYTPSWLVEHCISQAGRCHRPGVADHITILDPAAGSGSFLAHYITRIAATQRAVSVNIAGFDVNPLAVEFCQANTLIAVSKAREQHAGPSFNIQIHLADAVVDPMPVTPEGANPFQKSILGTTFSRGAVRDADLERVAGQFHLPAAIREAFLRTLRQYVSDTFAATRDAESDIIVGNPPWMAWDGLTRRYRDRLAPQWAASSLMVNKGWRAKVAAGKTEFSSLFVYRAAQRHAAANAVMVFVLPLSLFQSHLSGAGFRAFRTADDRRFALVELDDFSGVKVFPDAVNRTSVGTFAVDKTRQFPISYTIWSPARDESGNGQLRSVSCLGGPLTESEPSSPIVAFKKGRSQLGMTIGSSDYRARGGVNTGGANTILWLDVLAQADSACTVRNVGKSRRGSNPVVVAEIETDAVYPLLCGADTQRWKTAPGKSILLLYSPEHPRRALALDRVRSELPRAYDFVSQFRQQLEGRKEYHRWGCSGPFYEVYRIGPYTFSPIKVVWRHTGYRRTLNVAVVDDRGRRPAIPDQKVILIPFDDLEEAHYVCAFLSSSSTAALLDRYLGTDASTHILDYVALRKFAPRDEDHRRLAALSVFAHQGVASGADVAPLEKEIDHIVARLQQIQARSPDGA